MLRLHESADHSQPLVPSTPCTTPHPTTPASQSHLQALQEGTCCGPIPSPPRAEEMEMEDPATSIFSLWDQRRLDEPGSLQT